MGGEMKLEREERERKGKREKRPVYCNADTSFSLPTHPLITVRTRVAYADGFQVAEAVR